MATRRRFDEWPAARRERIEADLRSLVARLDLQSGEYDAVRLSSTFRLGLFLKGHDVGLIDALLRWLQEGGRGLGWTDGGDP